MNEMRSDADLVTAHVAGSRDALGVIYQRYGATLFDTAAAMLGDRDEAADVTQDVFLVAAERLGQLRDPERLKPWMFAILRNEVYRRTKKRRRTIVTDFSEPTAATVLPSHEEHVEELVSGDELAELVRGAARGLDERDQLVLELAVRQNLQGADLADALGVSAQQSYGLVHRMRERTERSLAAFCVARAGRRDCSDLDAILSDWDGEFTVLIRKRVARHIDACETCERNRRKLAPLALFGAAPAFAAPPDLWDRIAERLGLGSTDAPPDEVEPPYEFERDGGFPGAVRARRGAVLWLGAAAALVVLLVVGIVAGVAVSRDDGGTLRSAGGTTTIAAPAVDAPDSTDAAAPGTAATTDAADTNTSSSTSAASTSAASTSTVSTSGTTTSVPATTSSVAPATTAPRVIVPVTTAAPSIITLPPPPPPPPPPAALSLSAANLDFGSAANAANVTLTNTGGTAAAWSIAGSASPFVIAPTNGSLAPGQALVIGVTLDRTKLPEGSTPAAAVSFTAPGSAPAPLSMSASTIRRPPVIQLVSGPGATLCASQTMARFRATVTDESPVTVVLSWVPPAGTPGSVTMTPGTGATWSGQFAVATHQLGTWSWQITATDTFGNRSALPGQFQLNAC